MSDVPPQPAPQLSQAPALLSGPCPAPRPSNRRLFFLPVVTNNCCSSPTSNAPLSVLWFTSHSHCSPIEPESTPHLTCRSLYVSPLHLRPSLSRAFRARVNRPKKINHPPLALATFISHTFVSLRPKHTQGQTTCPLDVPLTSVTWMLSAFLLSFALYCVLGFESYGISRRRH